MKKLRLHPDELRVESFSPSAVAHAAAPGTVRGNQRPTFFQPGCWTAPGEATCDAAVYTCPECASPPETSFGCGDPET
jgi:hypothetical protein